jgi:hypothetical protein
MQSDILGWAGPGHLDALWLVLETLPNHGEGCKYANPLIVGEGLAGFVELAISSDGRYWHNTTGPQCLW